MSGCKGGDLLGVRVSSACMGNLHEALVMTACCHEDSPHSLHCPLPRRRARVGKLEFHTLMLLQVVSTLSPKPYIQSPKP